MRGSMNRVRYFPHDFLHETSISHSATRNIPRKADQPPKGSGPQCSATGPSTAAGKKQQARRP